MTEMIEIKESGPAFSSKVIHCKFQTINKYLGNFSLGSKANKENQDENYYIQGGYHLHWDQKCFRFQIFEILKYLHIVCTTEIT